MPSSSRLRLFSICAFAGLLALASLPAQVEPDPPARWWKGNLHTHTLWSDGDDFPEMITEWYRDKGYHFLALSDHNLLSTSERWMPVKAINARAGVDAFAKYRKRYGDSWVRTRGSASDGSYEVRLKTFDEYRTLVEERNRFLMIQSEELTGAAGDGRTLHMNASNLAEQLQYQVGSTIRETIVRNLQMVDESAKRTGREVMLHVNHPNYKWGVTAEDLAAVIGEQFFEVWNGVDGDNDPGDAARASTDEIWDIANTLRIARYGAAPLYGLATDDSHDYHGNKPRSLPGRGWIMVRARHLTPESIVRAIRAGQFYASAGVELDDVVFDSNSRTVSLKIQPRGSETFITRFIGTRKGASLEGKARAGIVGETTRDYKSAGGPAIGEVFAQVNGLAPSYRMRGDELYVRAVVISSATPDSPSPELKYKQAWTQPVGWR